MDDAWFNGMADELQETIALISEERGKLAAILETMGDGLLMVDADMGRECEPATAGLDQLPTMTVEPPQR